MNGATQEQDIRAALAYLNPDDRDEWIKAGMAIKAGLGESGYGVWNDWGQDSPAHKERDAQTVWRSFKRNGVGLGTLFSMAGERGWQCQHPRTGLVPQDTSGPEHKSAWIWKHATPAPADHPYLLRKGVKSYGLRLHKESLTIPLRNVAGELKTLQFILPQPKDGKDKLLLKDGVKAGAFFTLGQLPGAKVALLCEGYATGASLHEHTGLPVVICIDAGNLETVAKALRAVFVRLRLLICGDNDAHKPGSNVGKDKARAAAHSVIGGAGWCIPDFLAATDAEVSEEAGAHPTKAQRTAALAAIRQRDSQRYEVEKPTDFNDLTRWSRGIERLKAQIDAAVSKIALIEVRAGDLVRIVRQAEAELIFGGGVYQRSGDLVRPVRHDAVAGQAAGLAGLPPGALRLCEVTTHWLTERFATVATWKRFSETTQTWKAVDPPEQYSKTYLAKTGQWRAPVLTGVVEAPTLRRDGTLLNKPGYDAASGLYVDYAGAPINVPESPTREDALAALVILKEPYSEFQFADPAMGLSIALAATLTATVRRSLRTAPMMAFDAPVMGAGKGLLVKVSALIATGRPAPLLSQGQDEAEAEKRLGSMLLAGVSMINLDNIERPVGGELLCSMLTEPVCNPRILGKSESPEMPCNLTMFATGNNLQFVGDMVRRVLICRLDPGVERPDARRFNRNLNEWIPQNRARLLSAALTVLRAYIVAGKPKQPIAPYGSFEEWSDWIRSSLVWLGETDPCLSRTALEDDDPVLSSLHAVLSLWSRDLGPRVYTAAEVCQKAEGDLLLALLDVAAGRRDPDKLDAKRLGRWLLKHKGRVADGLRIVKGEDSGKKIALWAVIPAEANPVKPRENPANPVQTPSINTNTIKDHTGYTGFNGVYSNPTHEKRDLSHNANNSSIDVYKGDIPYVGMENKALNPVKPRTFNGNNDLGYGVLNPQTPSNPEDDIAAIRRAQDIADEWCPE